MLALWLVASGFFQAETNGWRRAALGSVRRATRRTEHRHQRLARIAADASVGLHRAHGLCGVSLGTRRALRPLWSLRALWSLGTRLALRAGYTLNALRTRIALRARISTASRQQQSNASHSHKNRSLHV